MKVTGTRTEAEQLYASVVLATAQRRASTGYNVDPAPRMDYVPYEPHPGPQEHFLTLTDIEALYGGAAGGGKSDAILMAALQYVHVPKYAALILRRTFPQLSQPGALLDRARDWLRPTDARWTQGRIWVFPSGARLMFGFLQRESDKYQYASAEFQYIGFDELTQFSATQYSFMFSRMRKPTVGPLSKVPLRMRSASNPGGVGHEWVKEKFPVMPDDERTDPVFVPAKLLDNPSVDYETYVESLMHLDPVTRAQLLEGDWHARESGGYFHREDFRIVDEVPKLGIQWARSWDLASTPVGPGSPDPDWTRGARVGKTAEGVWYISDMAGIRQGPGTVRRLVKTTADIDGISTDVVVEEEGGASGKDLTWSYEKELRGYNFTGLRSTGSKTTRATPVANEVDAGNVRLLRGEWNAAFIDEAEAFPNGSHDDQVDAVSGGFEYLERMGPMESETYSGITGRSEQDAPEHGDPEWDPYLELDS